MYHIYIFMYASFLEQYYLYISSTYCISSHLSSLEGVPQSEEFFLRLMPDNVLQMARLYLQYAPTTAEAPGKAINPILLLCGNLLDSLALPCPGIIEAVLLLAR